MNATLQKLYQEWRMLDAIIRHMPRTAEAAGLYSRRLGVADRILVEEESLAKAAREWGMRPPKTARELLRDAACPGWDPITGEPRGQPEEDVP